MHSGPVQTRSFRKIVLEETPATLRSIKDSFHGKMGDRAARIAGQHSPASGRD
jgi:hypothetical protein